jgi:hypothetical protein
LTKAASLDMHRVSFIFVFGVSADVLFVGTYTLQCTLRFFHLLKSFHWPQFFGYSNL